MQLGDYILASFWMIKLMSLVAFGDKIWPMRVTRQNLHKDRFDLGVLAKHMMSFSAADSFGEAAKHKTISIPSIGHGVDVKFQPSPLLVDFLELCFAKEGNLESVVKVGSPGKSMLC